jgi:hypothetical protein
VAATSGGTPDVDDVGAGSAGWTTDPTWSLVPVAGSPPLDPLFAELARDAKLAIATTADTAPTAKTFVVVATRRSP